MATRHVTHAYVNYRLKRWLLFDERDVPLLLVGVLCSLFVFGALAPLSYVPVAPPPAWRDQRQTPLAVGTPTAPPAVESRVEAGPTTAFVPPWWVQAIPSSARGLLRLALTVLPFVFAATLASMQVLARVQQEVRFLLTRKHAVVRRVPIAFAPPSV